MHKIAYVCSEHFWEDVSLTCCFQHVTCVFVGSFSSITSSQRYLSSLHMPFMSCIHAVCHLSFTIRWPTPACSQLLTPVFSTHFLNFQTFSDLLLSCYCSSLGGTCCEYSPIYLILFFKSMSKTFVLWYQERYHLLNGYTSDVLQILPVVTNFFLCPFSSIAVWRKRCLYPYHLSKTFCFMCMLLQCELLWER